MLSGVNSDKCLWIRLRVGSPRFPTSKKGCANSCILILLPVHGCILFRKTKNDFFVCCFPDAQRTILFNHGNGTDCGRCLSVVDLLRQSLSANVVFYEYPGYGVPRDVDELPTVSTLEKHAIAAYHKVPNFI